MRTMSQRQVEIVHRLCEKWDAAAYDEVLEGSGWYRNEAKAIGHVLDVYAPTLELGPVLVAMAIMSPRTNWDKLVDALGPWLHDPEHNKMPTFGKLMAKAEEVLAGRAWLPDPETAPKTNNFARALLGDPFAVTLDMWMMRAMGVPEEELTPLSYRYYDQAVTSAAVACQVCPRDFQAVVWVAERGPVLGER